MKSQSVLQALQAIPDPRGRQGRQYPLYGLLAILLLAAMHGERSLRGMWLWAREREKILLSYPQLRLRAVGRIPGLATFWYALSRLQGGALEQALQGLLVAEKDLALDGKSLRGSKRAGKADALQVVTLAGVILRQVWEQKVVEAGDEMATAIALLEEFSVEGKVISADAGILKAPFVQKVVEKKGATLA
ncbi:MAG: transposase family protein [Bacteroidota bacterium]